MILEFDIMLPPEVKIPQSVLDAGSRKILRNVQPLVEEKFVEAINQYVYSAYSPMSYNRRYTLTNSTTLGTISGTTLNVVTTASSPGWGYGVSGMGFLGAIQNPGPLWRGRFPRPADPNAYQEYIDNSEEIRAAIEKEVKSFIATLR